MRGAMAKASKYRLRAAILARSENENEKAALPHQRNACGSAGRNNGENKAWLMAKIIAAKTAKRRIDKVTARRKWRRNGQLKRNRRLSRNMAAAQRGSISGNQRSGSVACKTKNQAASSEKRRHASLAPWAAKKTKQLANSASGVARAAKKWAACPSSAGTGDNVSRHGGSKAASEGQN